MKRSLLTIALIASLLVSQSGCCSILHGNRSSRPESKRGSVDWGCFLVGNVLLFGGILGIIIDLSTGAAYNDRAGSDADDVTLGAPTSIPADANAVSLILDDGRVVTVARVREANLFDKAGTCARINGQAIVAHRWLSL